MSRLSKNLYNRHLNKAVNGLVNYANAAATIAIKATGKPNSELFSSDKGVASVVDTPKRIRKPKFTQVKTPVA